MPGVATGGNKRRRQNRRTVVFTLNIYEAYFEKRRLRSIVRTETRGLVVEEYLAIILGLFVLRFYGPINPNGVMSSAVSLPNHSFTGQDIFLQFFVKTCCGYS